MKKNLILAFVLAASPVLAEGPAEEIKAAAKKLAEAGSYSWTTSSPGRDGGQGGMSSEGKTDKSGVACIKSTFGERTTESVIKNGKVAVKTEEGWKSGEELAAAGREGGGRSGGNAGGGSGRRWGGNFAARMAQNFKTPAAEAEALASSVKELKKDGDVITGDLTDEAAKQRLSFGGRRGGGGGNNNNNNNNNEGRSAPAGPANAKGTVKFWVKDGTLAKYEVNLSGTFERNGESRDMNRTVTTEIKDAGTATIEVPAEATAKLDGGTAPAAGENKPAEPKSEAPPTELKK